MGCVSKNEVTRGVPWLDRGWKQKKKKRKRTGKWACGFWVASAQNRKEKRNRTWSGLGLTLECGAHLGVGST